MNNTPTPPDSNEENGPVYNAQPEPQGIVLAPVLAANPFVLFLLKYWKLLLGLVLVAVILFQNNHIDKQNLELQVAAEKVKTAEERLNTCSGTLDNLALRIEDLAQQSEGIKGAVDGLQPEIDRINRNTQRTVVEILKDKTPVTCEEIQQYILEPHNAFDWGVQK